MNKFTSALFMSMFIAGSAMAQTNLLSNASFEEWDGSNATDWVSTTTASNGTVEKSTDARTGSASILLKGTSSGNKRIAYKEITLKAGTYEFSIYAKGATAEAGSARPGYAPVNEDGSMGQYVYGEYYNDLANADWALVSYTFELAEQTKLNLVVMNSKNPGKDLLFDDASLTTTNGGIVEDGGSTEPTEFYNFKKATAVTSGKKYALVVENEGNTIVAKNLSEDKTYGYLYVDNADEVESDKVTMYKDIYSFTITEVEGGYTIQDAYDRYMIMQGTYNSFNVSAERTTGDTWTIEANGDGTFKITNNEMNKYIQYSVQYTSFGSYSDEQGLMPMLYEFESKTSDIAPVVVEDVNAPVEVYTINGVMVGNSLEGLESGLYLVKQGNKVRKVIK